MQRMRLWKENETRQPNQHTLWPNVLLYDPVFANDIRTDAIPTDFQSVLALSENMGPLSLYQFEAHNSYLHARSEGRTARSRCWARPGSWRRSAAA